MKDCATCKWYASRKCRRESVPLEDCPKCGDRFQCECSVCGTDKILYAPVPLCKNCKHGGTDVIGICQEHMETHVNCEGCPIDGLCVCSHCRNGSKFEER